MIRRVARMIINDTNKRIYKIPLIDIFMLFEVISVIFIYFFTVFEKPDIVSVAMIVNFSFMALMTGMRLMRFVEKKIFYIWFFLLLISLLSVYYTAYGVSFEYLRKWLMFASTVNMFFLICSIDIDEFMIKLFKITAILLALLFLFAYMTGRTGANFEEKFLTFNFNNPNFAAISILPISLYMIVFAFESKSLPFKFGYSLLALILLYFIKDTESRACIVAAAVFVILAFTVKRYNRFVTFCVTIFPLVFVGVYLLLIDTDFTNYFSFLVYEGKDLDSRVRIWKYVLSIIEMSPILGHYYIATGGGGVSNLHNLHLDTMASYGIIVFVMSVIMMNITLNYVGKTASRRGLIGILAFYAVIISGAFEAVLFSGSQGVYVLFGGFLMLAKYHQKQSIEEQIDNDDYKAEVAN